MLLKCLVLCFTCLPLCSQSADTSAMERQLQALVERAPRLPLRKAEFKIQVPSAGWELGYPSSVTMDKNGDIYVLQRGDKADSVLVLNREGAILRSWGKGMYGIPHSIRLAPDGNIWTVDAHTSTVLKFTPQGRKLMEIVVGGQPVMQSEFNGTTDVAFAPNGHLYISDGYANARILEYTADGKRLREWGKPGTGPGQFHLPHGIAADENGVLYVADRENGRIQRFDLAGRYLGEWANLGKVFSVTISGNALWIGTQQRNQPNGSAGWFMKIDRQTGNVLGAIDSLHGQHMINISTAGDLTAGARPDTVVWYRP